MTIAEFIETVKNDAALSGALEAEKPEGAKAFIEFAKKHGYEIGHGEIDESELCGITGGLVPPEGTSMKTGLCRHTGCGGVILNVMDLFHSCECEKCHETHYWLWSFDYYTE